MTMDELKSRLTDVVKQKLPLPGGGRTAERHQLLAETAREDLSLAKLAEAHWDAAAILAEAGRSAEPNMLYAVWASEIRATQFGWSELQMVSRSVAKSRFAAGLE
ncbi:hypothetical protein HDF13_000201 [Edaphobacter lichenicola]|uniref:Uncharacterized protein n=1 Tax=Tunturiibacter gelidiferens TaxID=3069689 RepID=A0ACC5NTG7_9BACT|nr:hypothetical protein [Edaphobacter lichenicola]